MSEGERPRRTRITAPRRTGARPVVSRPARAVPTAHVEIAEGTTLGRVYVDALIRAQLRLALLACLGLGAGLGGLPVLFLLLPRLGSTRLLGLPVPWLLLGVVVYPALVAAAWWHVRAAERAEQHFGELLGPR